MYKIYKKVENLGIYDFIIVDCYSNQYFHSSLTKFHNSVLGYGDYARRSIEGDQYIYIGECKYRKEVLNVLPMLDLLADI